MYGAAGDEVKEIVEHLSNPNAYNSNSTDGQSLIGVTGPFQYLTGETTVENISNKFASNVVKNQFAGSRESSATRS